MNNIVLFIDNNLIQYNKKAVSYCVGQIINGFL